MARINLLPWRAERRKLREREFYLQLGMAFAAAVVAVLIWVLWMNARIDNQNDRNAYLQAEIKQLDERIDKIKDLEKVRSRLLQRKQIIEQLQANRSQMVHLFDEMVRTIPSSARLTAMKQSADSLSLDGVSQSNASVADYMRNIEASPWMGHVDLRKTENSHDSSRMPYSFGLDVKLTRPGADDANDDSKPIVPASSSTAAAPASATVPAVLGKSASAVTAVPSATSPATVQAAAPSTAPAVAPAGAGHPATPTSTGGAKP
jgi:type IV pilus assembly protein PilN